ncbi:cyanophycinase [Dyadobacter sp. NIV53]|uniref:cyanophycinase n=1 Tax=Dyadobacter sp. NIV53 TaxID=2861765 RepID=UPI001C882286|nr:cyanophycinase [Dyadobacter sp. NIV53]
MKYYLIRFFAAFVFLSSFVHAQIPEKSRQGNLFIIGGGDRSPDLMRELVAASGLGPKDYVVVLPMSGANPDTSFHYFKADLEPVCSNKIINLNFKTSDVNNKLRLDSLANAKLVFITGGDQERFMKVVLNTPVYDAIHKAFAKGATIAGTSAGAAVMSHYMISGRELVGDTTLRATFRKVKDRNIDIQTGLGLLTDVIVDQHFIVRSRYNRLFSALAKYPDFTCVGIDEATAIVVTGNQVKVVGESQVVVMKNPAKLKVTESGLIKMEDIQFSLYTAGDVFRINKRSE